MQNNFGFTWEGNYTKAIGPKKERGNWIQHYRHTIFYCEIILRDNNGFIDW